MIRAIETTDLFELLEWCQEYRLSKRCTTTDVSRRFAIGFYQIYQGIKWRDCISGRESFAASFLHFLMICDLLNLPIEQEFPRDLDRYVPVPSYEMLLEHLSHSQQMLIYFSDTYGVKRKSRYDSNILLRELAASMKGVLFRVNQEHRAEALYNAMMVMTGET